MRTGHSKSCWTNRSSRCSGWGLLICLVAGLSGCVSAGKFSPNNLPHEWEARPVSNVRTVDLSRLATVSVPADQISPGDVLELNIAAGLGSDGIQEFVVRVSDRGEIDVPDVGVVALNGLDLEDAENVIKTAFVREQIYRNPHVTVTMKQKKEVEVTVVGAVQEQGTFKLRSGSAGLLHAISLAGGFADDAGTELSVRLPESAGAVAQDAWPAIAADGAATHSLVNHQVPVHTGGARTIKVDLASMHGEGHSQMQLVDGSVIEVERRDPLPLHVTGLVKKEDVYEYPVGKNIRVVEAIAMAGGMSSLVADKIYVIRRRPDQPQPVVIQVSYRKAKTAGGAHNLLLEPGDTVSVEQTPTTVILETIRTLGFGLSGRVF
ncbi:MAG: SLBB domain-containing protein [Planctomycetaceae bacterium]|nr:SLBB domain-containing protein [Planctomycetaceae bacterium]